MSLKESFLSSAVLRTGQVTIDDVTYTVREVNAASFDEYAELLKNGRNEATALLISRSLLDEAGEFLLTFDEAKAAMDSGRVIRPIVSEALRLSGLTAPENKSNAS